MHIGPDSDFDYEEQVIDRFCPRCQCCDTDYEQCWNCDEGFSGRAELLRSDMQLYGPANPQVLLIAANARLLLRELEELLDVKKDCNAHLGASYQAKEKL